MSSDLAKVGTLRPWLDSRNGRVSKIMVVADPLSGFIIVGQTSIFGGGVCERRCSLEIWTKKARFGSE